MKVIVSVSGRFHLFYLAQQLLKRDHLARLITSYPKFEVVKYGIPKEKTSSIVSKEILERGWRELPLFLRSAIAPEFAILDLYDRISTRRLVAADIFVGFATSSLRAMREAKRRGMVTIAEHGSAHPEYQKEILLEEYRKFGIKPPRFEEKLMEKSLVAFAEADYIAVPSLFAKRTFLERGFPESKMIHVPYGVDLSAFREDPKEDDVFRVIFVGAMTLQKGVHYLLQAFSELRLPNSELILVGAMQEEMKPFSEKYKGSFKYIGHVPQSELYKQYSRSSVFVMCSIQEGLAVVQAQAMACGLPIITTTNTGGEDIARDGIDGFVIPIRDVAVLKEKIAWMYDHPSEREAMGRSAKEHVSSGFTWDDYGDRIVDAYTKALAAKRLR